LILIQFYLLYIQQMVSFILLLKKVNLQIKPKFIMKH